MLAARRQENDFMQMLGDDSAALSVARVGGRDAEKSAQFSLASFTTLLGLGRETREGAIRDD